MHLILASTSPRRRQLLTAAGYSFDVVPPSDDAESGLCSNCGPAELVAQLATPKQPMSCDSLRQWAVASGESTVGKKKKTGDTE